MPTDLMNTRAKISIGTSLNQQGKTDEAVAAIRDAISISPNNGFLHVQLGHAFNKQSRWDEAAAAFQTALAIDPKNIGAKSGLATTFNQQGKTNVAVAIIRDAISNAPNNAAMHVQLGYLCNKQSCWDEAAAAFQAALAIDPKNIEAKSGLGITFSQQGKIDEAVAVVRDAISNSPNHAAIHIQLGSLFNKQSRWGEAAAAFQAAMAIDPKSIGALSGLGRTLNQQGRTDEAISAIRRAISSMPNNADLYVQLGHLFNQQGLGDDAVTAFEGARGLLLDAERRLAASPSPSPEQILAVKRGLAENAMLRGAWEEAVDRWAWVRTASPGDLSSYERGAEALLRSGRHDDQALLISEAFSRFPNSPLIARRHAQIAVAARQWGEAATRWANVRSRFPHEISGYTQGAQALIYTGVLPEARALLDKAVAKFPESDLVQLMRLELILDRTNWHEITDEWLKLRERLQSKPKAFYRLSWNLYIQRPLDAKESIFLDSLFSEPEESNPTWKPEIIARLTQLFRIDIDNFRAVSDDLIIWIQSKEWQELCPIARVVGVALGLPVSEEKLGSLIGQYLSTRKRSVLGFMLEPKLARFCRGDGDQCPRVFDQYLNDTLSVRNFSKVDLNSVEFLYNSLMFSYFYRQETFSFVKGRVREITKNLDSAIVPINLKNILSAVSTICASSLPDPSGSAAPQTFKDRAIGRRLKIALCVSGQLRGYKAANETWGNLRLHDHDITTFVHTWKTVGRKVPKGEFQHASRTFSGEFLKAFIDLHKTYDDSAILGRYPKLFEYLRAGESVSETELRKFYKTEHVIVEDEEQSTFSKFTNSMKMHYKIEKSHEMAKSIGDFDLYIRIRPDLEFLESPQDCNWNDIFHASTQGNIVFANDRPRIAAHHFFAIGDMFAVGTGNVMDVYSHAWSFSLLAFKDKLYDFPSGFSGHTNLAYTTLYQGVRVEATKGVRSGSLIDPEVLQPEQVRRLLLADIGSQPRDTSDAMLLNAVEMDLGG